jgi:thiol-disulfide isomerase/thioredoxin
MKQLTCSFLLGIALILSGALSAQEYEIEINVKGVSDTTILLGHHFGAKKYVIDTVHTDKNGNVVFKGDEPLKCGIYLAVLPSIGNRYFEFLVGDDQHFKIETDTANFIENMKIKGSKENEVFNSYQLKMSEYQIEVMAIQKSMKALSADDVDSTKIYRDQLGKIGEKRLEYMQKIIGENEGSLLGKILNAILDPEIPDAPTDKDGNITDSTFRYRYYKEHYFDNIDFSESGLIRTPILEPRIDNFFNRVVTLIPDSIIPEATKIIVASRANDDMFRYVVSHLLNYFETSHIMGMDKVFVTIAEDWYLSGEAYWADSTYLSKIEERVKKITPTFIGSIAADIKQVPTSDGKYASLHKIDAEFTILIFWEPNCGYCKTVVPKLHEIYKDTLKAQNVEVFSVNTQRDKEKWIKFINDKGLDLWYNVYDPYGFTNLRNNYDIYSTPVIYVLDRDKRIIAKRINVDNITKFLDYQREKQKKEKESLKDE